MLYIVWLTVGLVVGVWFGVKIAISNINPINENEFELFDTQYKIVD